MWGTTSDTSQDGIQIFILIIAVLSIPVMLLVKPLHIISKMKKSDFFAKLVLDFPVFNSVKNLNFFEKTYENYIQFF